MGIKEISILSTNPHYYAFLLHSFLSGYNRPCAASLLFMALPILLCVESREKLLNANNRSKMESLFSSPININENAISGKTRLAGYLERYKALSESCKKAIIILSSEKKISIKNSYISALHSINYGDFNGEVRNWFRAAFYLGLIFSKADEDYLCYFLGVDKHE